MTKVVGGTERDFPSSDSLCKCLYQTKLRSQDLLLDLLCEEQGAWLSSRLTTVAFRHIGRKLHQMRRQGLVPCPWILDAALTRGALLHYAMTPVLRLD